MSTHAQKEPMPTSATDADMPQLLTLLYRGSAVLLAGERIHPEFISLLQSRLREHHPTSVSRSFEDLRGHMEDPVLWRRLVSESEAQVDPTLALKNIAAVPWCGVISSGFDRGLINALQNAYPMGRRLKFLFASESGVKSFVRRAQVLPLLQLGRMPQDNVIEGIPNASADHRRSRSRFMPSLIGSLPELIGLGQALCIAGVGHADLIDIKQLTEVLKDLDGDKVFWFITEDEALDIQQLCRDLPTVHFITRSLESSLESGFAKEALREEAKLSLASRLDLGDLVVTVRTRASDQSTTLPTTTIRFSAEELREFRPHLMILPDYREVPPLAKAGDRYQALVSFLKGPQSLHLPQTDYGHLVFVRRPYRALIEALQSRINLIEGVDRPKGVGGPFMLAGPPASGRTVGLHWAGMELRRLGIFTVFLSPLWSGLDPTSIEKILRIAEKRGAPLTVVLVDRQDRRTVKDLERGLRRAGRRALVIASAAPLPARSRARSGQLPVQEENLAGTEVNISYELSPGEWSDFGSYLAQNGVPDPQHVGRQLSEHDRKYFFALLYRIIPDSRHSIINAILDEYRRLEEALATFTPPLQRQMGGQPLRDQILRWMAIHPKQLSHSMAQGEAEIEDARPHSAESQAWRKMARELPRAIMLLSRFDYPASTDLLGRHVPMLLRYYTPLVSVLEHSGLAYETPVDYEGTVGLTAVNQLLAEIIIEAVEPNRASQLALLGGLLQDFPWSDSTHSPEQRGLVALLRNLSPPQGTYHAMFQRWEDLMALAEVYRSLREERCLELPSLMLTEGIVLRELGVKSENTQGRHEYYKKSQEILERTRELIYARPRTPARDFELANTLIALSTTVGHLAHSLAELKADAMDPQVQQLVEQTLRLATSSRAYNEVYHPLDVAYWINRDVYRKIVNVSGSAARNEKMKLISNMAGALDAASELEWIDEEQRRRYRKRCVEFQMILGNVEVARKQAEEDAERGRFGGICILARLKAIDAQTNTINSRKRSSEALDSLLRYAPGIFGEDEALTLMHRLWVGKHLGEQTLDTGPHVIATTQDDWNLLERIAQARNAHGRHDPLPYASFWMAVAQAHQGDFVGAMKALDTIHAHSVRMERRRFSPLVIIANREGAPALYKSVLRRRDENGQVIMFVLSLGIEVAIRPRYTGGASLLNAQKGDEIGIHLAFSFWNPQGLTPDWRLTSEPS